MTLMQDQAEAMLRGKRLVFLVGAARSGTTWLQLLLSRSPAVATAAETLLFNIFMRSMLDEWHLTRDVDIGVKEVLSPDELISLLQGVSGLVLAKIAQRKPSATIVLEKTPGHIHHWREILDLWPEAHFIHIIRDPRSVVASMKIASKSWAPDWRRGLSTNCETWVAAVRDGRQIRSATQNYQEVTFEELRSDGPEALTRLLRGLGAEANPAECQRYIDDCGIANLEAGRLENAPFGIAGVSRRGETDSWRVELSKWEIAFAEYLAGPLMSELGYGCTKHNAAMSTLVKLSYHAFRGVKDVGRVATHRLQRVGNQVLPV